MQDLVDGLLDPFFRRVYDSSRFRPAASGEAPSLPGSSSFAVSGGVGGGVRVPRQEVFLAGGEFFGFVHAVEDVGLVADGFCFGDAGEVVGAY